MAFYGECHGMDWGVNVTGTPITTFSDLYYHFDGTSQTVDAGEAFTIGLYEDSLNATSTDAMVLSWVIECGAGSNGTLQLSDGADPAWSYTAAVCTNDLGSHVVSGKKSVVVAASISKADYYAQVNEPTLLVQCTSGTVEVVQIKMRVWPPGGPSGDWVSSADSQLITSYDYTLNRRLGDLYITGSGSQATIIWGETAYVEACGNALAAARANLQSKQGTVYTFNSSGVWAYGQMQYQSQSWFKTDTLEHGYKGTAQISDDPGYIKANTANVTPVTPNNSGNDPREIWREQGSWLRGSAANPGLPTGTFAGWLGTLKAAYSTSTTTGPVNGWPVGPAVVKQISDQASSTAYVFLAGGADTAVSPGAVNGAYSVVLDNIPIFGGEQIAIIARPPGATDGYPEPAKGAIATLDPNTGTNMYDWSTIGTMTITAGTDAPRYQVSFPAGSFQYFDETLPWPSEAPPEPTNFDLVDGVYNSVADGGEYIFTGEVDNSAPEPHLWFLFRPYAFGGDHVLIYGTGLGSPQSEYNGHMWLDWGPNYATTDWEPTVVGWTTSPASSQAYTGQGQIFPGTDATPPVVDVEVQVVEVIIPPEIVGQAAYRDFFYAVTDYGVSNQLPLMVYPISPVGMASTAPSNRVRTSVRVGSVMPAGGEVIPQEIAAYKPSTYIVSSNRPERMPEFAALGYSKMILTGGTATSGAEDPVNVVVETQLRWRPIDTYIVPRSDLGTGASVWTPTTASSQGWKFLNTSAPYIDPTHSYPSRLGTLSRPSMVFDGVGWMELVNAVPSGPAFTLFLVAQLYATGNPKSVILSSYPTGTPDPNAYPLELALVGDELQLTIGGSLATARLASGYVGQRPVIIGIRTDGTEGGLAVISSSAFSKDFVHPKLDTTGLKLYLGRDTDTTAMMIARMDVLDAAFSDYKFSSTTLWRQMNILDSAYGVSQ